MADAILHTTALNAINQKLVADGERLPAVKLKDASTVQTGGTVEHHVDGNIEHYNQGARGDVERQLELAVPTLAKIGLFDLFSPHEWCAESRQSED